MEQNMTYMVNIMTFTSKILFRNCA